MVKLQVLIQRVIIDIDIRQSAVAMQCQTSCNWSAFTDVDVSCAAYHGQFREDRHIASYTVVTSSVRASGLI